MVSSKTLSEKVSVLVGVKKIPSKFLLINAILLGILINLKPVNAQTDFQVQNLKNRLENLAYNYKLATSPYEGIGYRSQAIMLLTEIDIMTLKNPIYCQFARDSQNYAKSHALIDMYTNSHTSTSAECVAKGFLPMEFK
ncbi:hypothetical protein AFK68_19365 [Hydrocoleum sp. CS-953]|uniref:hypothetical protein n=1 Tax=Hydrocoleum sp. CS-953 TaxID=1671698 RepID=UPI000B9AA229|nr:hypothetical protein [Hydrocoleum sp. CS-953]OZH53186.1 hypothetical protein AFK68_19365 [Hydrocoleum sp. CS-953]